MILYTVRCYKCYAKKGNREAAKKVITITFFSENLVKHNHDVCTNHTYGINISESEPAYSFIFQKMKWRIHNHTSIL